MLSVGHILGMVTATGMPRICGWSGETGSADQADPAPPSYVATLETE